MAVRQNIPNETAYLQYNDNSNANNNENIVSTISANDYTISTDFFYNPLTDQNQDNSDAQFELDTSRLPSDLSPNLVPKKCSDSADPNAYGPCITSFPYPIGKIPGPVYFPPPTLPPTAAPPPMTAPAKPPTIPQSQQIENLHKRTDTIRTTNVAALKNSVSSYLNNGNNIGFNPCDGNSGTDRINSNISQINNINNAANTMISQLKDLQALTTLYKDVQKSYQIRLDNLTTQYFSLKGDKAKQIDKIDKAYNAQIAAVKKEKGIIDKKINEVQEQIANYQMNIIPNAVNMYNYGAYQTNAAATSIYSIHEEIGNNLTEYYNQVVKQNSNMENQLATEKTTSITNNREAEQMTVTLTTFQTTKSYMYYLYYALLLLILINVYYQKTRVDMIVQSVILIVLFLLPMLGGVVVLKVYEFLSYSASLIFGTVYKNRNVMYNENNSSEPIDYNKNTGINDIRQPRAFAMFTYIYTNYLESMLLWQAIAIISAIGLGGFMYLYTRSR